ncbi:oxidoreductase [Sphingomonas sp. ST-64]|uniref:Oxidoreductase n=1 Tax=Sphingomonas plantiphila TaxID=3163295 RepID=A0ABW8YMN4_9SPHN
MVRVGLVGFGFASRTFHAPLIGAVEGMKIVAVASSDPAKVACTLPGVAVVASHDALIARDDLDLIVIASPNETHAPIASAALTAGKHVVIDKPFTVTLDEARGLIAQAENAGRLLSVFHNRRWDSDFLSVSRAIRDGLVGEVAQFESHFDRFRPEVRDRWRERVVPGGGIWFDLGPHLVDQALCLFGLPDWVQGDLAIQRAGGQADDWAQVVLGYGAMRVVLHASMLVAGGSARFTVHGQRGSLIKARIDQQEAQLLAGMVPGSTGWGLDDDALTLFDGAGEKRIAAERGDQRRYYAGIGDAIRGEGANPVPAIEGLAAMAVIDAAQRSSQHGVRVEPALSDSERLAYAAARGQGAAR